MNTATFPGRLRRLQYRLLLGARHVWGKPTCQCLGVRGPLPVIQRIYAINLDRQGDRWRQMQRELQSVRDRSKRPLIAIARRFSAVDARYFRGLPDSKDLQPDYALADQLFVDPHPSLGTVGCKNDQRILMTRQEMAVALSHIAVWKTVAASHLPYTLVLEDDVYFRRGFARTLDRAWAELLEEKGQATAFDLLYLSFMEARMGADRAPVSELLFRPRRGLWCLSGYVLSARGAKRLLDLLPVRGPVDLWINHQFGHLDVIATQQSIIEQRLDCPSTNSYSILPILSKLGVLTRERPLLFRRRSLPGPVFAFGKQGSGLTSLAMALSMIGYRCCSDVTDLPAGEYSKLFANKRGRVFDAYVNVGSLGPRDYLELSETYPLARFIVAKEDDAGLNVGDSSEESCEGRSSDHGVGLPNRVVAQLQKTSRNVLIFPTRESDKWELLRRFLGCDYPTDQYPQCHDQPQRMLDIGCCVNGRQLSSSARPLMSDSSPWIAAGKDWSGIRLCETSGDRVGGSSRHNVCERFQGFDRKLWLLRDDTFPSNLALFNPDKFSIGSDSIARLTLQKERTSVREYASASICSRERYLYGRFAAEVKPSNVPGLITGMFLHRNSPRQEIDLEFIGRDTTKLLVNVYYNPGDDGARMEYGYRGTPVLIDLGFDASEAFHRYEIEWRPASIRWCVDGRLAHERVIWNPTPIPHLPMQLNVNLWHSMSAELAGKLADDELPAQTELRAIEISA